MAKFTKRSRSGCVNCKASKLKCDEGKPSCTRCEKRGKLCTYSINIKNFDSQPSKPKNTTEKTNTNTTTITQKELTATKGTSLISRTSDISYKLQLLFNRNFKNKDNNTDFSKIVKRDQKF